LRYSRFELFVMAVGVVVVVGTIFALISGNNVASNIVGQILILVALFGGLHYGRKGALAGFMIATGVNAIVTFATITGDSSVALQLFVYRTIVYAFVALIAGELINVRLKYMFVKLEHREYVDDITSLFNRRYLSMLIERYMNESDRYSSSFSLTSFLVREDLFTPLKEKLVRKLIKDLGNSVVRGSIRGPDEAARVGTTKFAVLWANTSIDGAMAATLRVKGKINHYLDRCGLTTEKEDTVTAEVFEYPRDREALEELVIDLSATQPGKEAGAPL